MTARRIAVLMGGESQERDISRVTGTEVAKALRERGHRVTLLDTREGVLSLDEAQRPRIGRRPPELGENSLATAAPREISTLSGALADVDVVFVALHGGWGEDGTVQAFFELNDTAYTGSGVLGSALAMNKDRAKRVFRASGIPTPDWVLLNVDPDSAPAPSELDAAVETLGVDLIVKPNREGSTVGLRRVGSRAELSDAVLHAARFGSDVLIETFVPGRELTVGVLGDDALPVVEIFPEEGIYSYEAKYTSGRSRYEVPAELPGELETRIRASGLDAFRALDCDGFARADFRLAPDGSFHCLEVNTIPGMTPLSLLPMAAQAAGISFPELVERIVEHGIARKARRSRAEGAEA